MCVYVYVLEILPSNQEFNVLLSQSTKSLTINYTLYNLGFRI